MQWINYRLFSITDTAWCSNPDFRFHPDMNKSEGANPGNCVNVGRERGFIQKIP